MRSGGFALMNNSLADFRITRSEVAYDAIGKPIRNVRVVSNQGATDSCCVLRVNTQRIRTGRLVNPPSASLLRCVLFPRFIKSTSAQSNDQSTRLREHTPKIKASSFHTK